MGMIYGMKVSEWKGQVKAVTNGEKYMGYVGTWTGSREFGVHIEGIRLCEEKWFRKNSV